MPQIIIDEFRCKGCGLCVRVCPKQLILLSEHINNYGYTPALFMDSDMRCTGCALCASMCPDVAILVYK